jgi:hypothetical protein
MRRRSIPLAAVLVAAASGHVPAAYAGGSISLPISGLVAPTDLAAADFDGNGRADLAIVDAGDLSVRLNQGGVFATRVLPQTGAPDQVATGDLDHDGRPDIVTLSRAERAVDLNVQDGAGGWTTRSLANVAVDPAAIAVGDLNGDGWSDLAVSDAGVDSDGDYVLHLFLRDPLSTDYHETTLTNFHDAGNGGPRAVAIGDLDADGRMDLATANGDNTDTVSLFVQQASGGYQRLPLKVAGSRRADAIAIGEIGGSGPGADIAVGYDAGASRGVTAFISLLAGTLYESLEYYDGSGPEQASYDAISILRVAGQPAIAATNPAPGHNVTVWAGRSGASETFSTAAGASGLAAGDFDGDGKTDLATLLPAAGKGLLVTNLSPPSERPISSCGGSAMIARRARCSTVPVVTALELENAPLSFGAFMPGVTRDYSVSTTAHVLSTAGRAALTVSVPGNLANGAYALDSPLAVTFSKSTWEGPVSNGQTTVTFKQHIDAGERLHSGHYGQTVTFTLAPTTP